MKLIHITNNEALKLGGAGAIKYQLWVDSGGSLYVQVEENAAVGDLFATAILCRQVRAGTK